MGETKSTKGEFVMPAANKEISDEDFAEMVNRAQGIVLYLQTLKLPVQVVDSLYLANDALNSAMRRKIGR